MLLRRTCLFLCSLLVFCPESVFGFSPDLLLLQLVPPESRIVAGMLPSSSSAQLNGFLIVTPNNKVDLKDFFALVGGDPSRSIHEFLFTSSVGPDGVPRDHSLLASGRFNREAIFRLANDKSIRRQNYRGVVVLAVEPFVREFASFKELRWLAIPDKRIAIFGSIASVQGELDRWLSNSPIDPDLLERLDRLNGSYETWCLLPAPRLGGPVASILGKLDARLEVLADEERSIQFGIHIGKDVEITASNNPATLASSNTPDDPQCLESRPLFCSFSETKEAGHSTTVRVTIRRQAYKTWLAGFSGTVLLSNCEPFR